MFVAFGAKTKRRRSRSTRDVYSQTVRYDSQLRFIITIIAIIIVVIIFGAVAIFNARNSRPLSFGDGCDDPQTPVETPRWTPAPTSRYFRITRTAPDGRGDNNEANSRFCNAALPRNLFLPAREHSPMIHTTFGCVRASGQWFSTRDRCRDVFSSADTWKHSPVSGFNRDDRRTKNTRPDRFAFVQTISNFPTAVPPFRTGSMDGRLDRNSGCRRSNTARVQNVSTANSTHLSTYQW